MFSGGMVRFAEFCIHLMIPLWFSFIAPMKQQSDRPDPGAHVVTPFRRTDGWVCTTYHERVFVLLTPFSFFCSSTILVNRGFVPDNLRSAEARREGQVQGTVAIEGIVRNGESVSWLFGKCVLLL